MDSSVLINRNETRALEQYDLRHFPVDFVDGVLLPQTQEQPSGVKNAVRLLLTRAGTAIYFFNLDAPQEPWTPGNPSYYDGGEYLLGYNDHEGGSESDFKLYVNRGEGEDRKGYVLHAPPDEDGVTSNTTFRHSDFTFMTWQPDRVFRNDLPNILKTHNRNDSLDSHFFLFGSETTAALFEQTFERIGFNFEDEPYSWDEHDRLLDLERAAVAKYKEGGDYYRTMGHWPHQQFAAQLALLEQLEI